MLPGKSVSRGRAFRQGLLPWRKGIGIPADAPAGLIVHDSLPHKGVEIKSNGNGKSNSNRHGHSNSNSNGDSEGIGSDRGNNTGHSLSNSSGNDNNPKAMAIA